jgi:hypothetical protein
LIVVDRRQQLNSHHVNPEKGFALKRLPILRGAAATAAIILAGAGLLSAGGTARAATKGGEARAISVARTSAAPCTAWNLSSNIVYVYSRADTGSAAWGYLWGGGGTGSSAQCAYSGTSTVWGAPHNLCGGGSLYVAVYYWVGGTYVIAYVPDACVWVAY